MTNYSGYGVMVPVPDGIVFKTKAGAVKQAQGYLDGSIVSSFDHKDELYIIKIVAKVTRRSVIKVEDR